MVLRLDPKKFSEYPPEPSVDGTELIPIVKDGANSSVEVSTLWEDNPLVPTITVGASEPLNPELNDLWVDTS